MATGGSQCGFCTPGHRDAPGRPRPVRPHRPRRSTRPWWPTCVGAPVGRPSGRRRVVSSVRRPPSRPCGGGPQTSNRPRLGPTIEGGVAQRVGPAVVSGDGRVRRRRQPCRGRWWRYPTAAVATPWPSRSRRPGRWPARCRAGAPACPSATRSTCRPATGRSPCGPPGWSRPTSSPTPRGAGPGRQPASPYGNGGAFGGKLHSPVAAVARRLADEHGRPVRVLWSREDVVRYGPKRPPVAGGVDRAGAGILRVGVAADGADPAVWATLVADRGHRGPRAGARAGAPAPARRWPSICAARCGWRPRCWRRRPGRSRTTDRADTDDVPIEVVESVRRPGGGPVPSGRLDRPGGDGRGGARPGGAAFLLHRGRPPGPRLGAVRGRGRRRRRRWYGT